MNETLKHHTSPSRQHDTRAPNPSSVIDDQVFQFNLATIMSAHLYGHISEAYALRAIARAIQEFLV